MSFCRRSTSADRCRKYQGERSPTLPSMASSCFAPKNDLPRSSSAGRTGSVFRPRLRFSDDIASTARDEWRSENQAVAEIRKDDNLRFLPDGGQDWPPNQRDDDQTSPPEITPAFKATVALAAQGEMKKKKTLAQLAEHF